LKDGLRTTWHKSSHSTQEGGQCVEVAELENSVGVRDSTDPHGPVLLFGRDAMAGLLTRIKTGELDR
jgi:hypothetical protein